MVLSNDNSESRKMIDSCYKKRKTVLNPIIDWTDDDVWEFIKEYQIPYCELYDQGYKRIGCIGCPMNTAAAAELEKYPKYKALYIKAFEEMLKVRKAEGKIDDNWKDGQDVMDWWLSGGTRKNIKCKQIDLTEEIERLQAEYE